MRENIFIVRHRKRQMQRLAIALVRGIRVYKRIFEKIIAEISLQLHLVHLQDFYDLDRLLRRNLFLFYRKNKIAYLTHPRASSSSMKTQYFKTAGYEMAI